MSTLPEQPEEEPLPPDDLYSIDRLSEAERERCRVEWGLRAFLREKSLSGNTVASFIVGRILAAMPAKQGKMIFDPRREPKAQVDKLNEYPYLPVAQDCIVKLLAMTTDQTSKSITLLQLQDALRTLFKEVTTQINPLGIWARKLEGDQNLENQHISTQAPATVSGIKFKTFQEISALLSSASGGKVQSGWNALQTVLGAERIAIGMAGASVHAREALQLVHDQLERASLARKQASKNPGNTKLRVLLTQKGNLPKAEAMLGNLRKVKDAAERIAEEKKNQGT